MERSFTKPDIVRGMVSCIIPTYNRAAFLEEAITSVFNQTYRPVECIVVDDGSTDNTRYLIEGLSKKNNDRFKLVYIFQENAGSQVARNTGTRASNGEFIQYLDSDDLLYPDKFETQINYLKEHVVCDAVYGNWRMGDPGNYSEVPAYKKDDLILQFLNDKCIANFSFLMRRSMIDRIGDWDVALKRNQEIDFHLRGVLAGGNFDYQPLTCGLWRKHSELSITSNQDLTGAIYFFTKWEKILDAKGLLTAEMKTGIANNYLWFLSTSPGAPGGQKFAIYKNIYSLLPQHPVFNTWTIRALRAALGMNLALRAMTLKGYALIAGAESYMRYHAGHLKRRLLNR